MSRKILLVDDEPDMMEVVVFRLRKAGYEVNTASTGREGLEAARTMRPDLILLDYRLPDMLGSDACRILKSEQETADIPVIFISASTGAPTSDLVKSSGACDFILKPFDLKDFYRKIDLHIRPPT